MQHEKECWAVVHTERDVPAVPPVPFDWDACDTVAVDVAMVASGIQVCTPFLQSFGLMVAVKVEPTAFVWAIVSSAMASVSAMPHKQIIAAEPDSCHWSLWWVVCLAMIIGTVGGACGVWLFMTRNHTTCDPQPYHV